MEKKQRTEKLIRRAVIAAVAAAGAAMFIAAVRTKFLPASYLAALGGGLALLATLIALVVRGGRKLRLCAGMLLAAPYIFMSLTGFTLANRTQKLLSDAVVSVSPTVAPAPADSSEPASGSAPDAAAEEGYPDVFTIYVSGIDSRKGLVDKSYSDANIIFTVNRTTHQILLVTTPRDAFVPVPGTDGARDKLTHLGNFSGIDMLVDSMEATYDIDIDYWFRIGFTGFEDVVDALGGVTVDSDYTFTGRDFDFADQIYTFDEGENVLNGDQALVFARERMSFPDGDVQRGRDQMKLIVGMIDKVLSPDLLNNYTEVLDSLEGEFETTVPYDLLAELVRDQLADGAEWNVVSYTLCHCKSDYQVTYSMPELGERFVSWLSDDDLATAKDLMAKVRGGEIIEQPDIYTNLQ